MEQTMTVHKTEKAMDTSNTGLEPIMTVPQAARYLKLSKSQLYLLIQKRKIPHIRLTERRIVILEKDLKKFLERSRVDVTHP
jgi:excisionase family DNA binding protein